MEELQYISISNNRSHENYERIKKNSVKKQSSKKIHKNNSFKKYIYIGVLTSAISAAIGMGIEKKLETDNRVNLLTKTARESIEENKNQIDYKKYSLDHLGIAQNINEKQFDIEVFGVYKNIHLKYNEKINNMNEIFNWLHLLGKTDYKTFEEYAIKNGFVNKDGTFDHDKYMKDMNNYLKEVVNSDQIIITIEEEKGKSI